MKRALYALIPLAFVALAFPLRPWSAGLMGYLILSVVVIWICAREIGRLR